jgi:PAS domain S-box-containing protein
MAREMADLRTRLAQAEETLRAIHTGEVDTLLVAGKHGAQVYTLEGAEQAYRFLIESMNEGALTLTGDKLILYANQCFARMVKCPLEQVTGSSFRRFLSVEDQITLRKLMQRTNPSGSKVQVLLKADTGAPRPVQISIRRLARKGARRATITMVVTDMTASRRSEEQLQTLSHRLVDVQETERRRVAVELHENISQLTYAILMRCDTLAGKLPPRADAARAELLKLRDLLDRTTEEVRRIARDLRPTALDDLGLLPVLRMAAEHFAERTSVPVDLTDVRRLARLPDGIETALYRILQEVLKNIERHASAHHVTMCLQKQGKFVELSITDDGIGFDPRLHPARRTGNSGLGLHSMRERAASVGGTLEIESAAGQGTTIRARIPFSANRSRRTIPKTPVKTKP